MKFSKVNNIRLIVKKSENQNLPLTNTIMYNKTDLTARDIRDVVTNRITESQNLYGLFNERKLKHAKSKQDQLKLKEVKREIYNLNKKIRIYLSSNSGTALNITSEFSSEIKLTIRKSMARFENVIYKLLCGQNLDENESKEFLKALVSDFTKDNIKENVINSIESQNVSVKIEDDNFIFSKTKRPVYDFIHKYSKDSSALKNLQIHIKKLFFQDENENNIFVKVPDKETDIVDLLASKIYDHKHLALQKLYSAEGVCTCQEDAFWVNKIYSILIAEFTSKKYNKRRFDKNGEKVHHIYKYEDIYKVMNAKIANYITAQFLSIGKAVYHFYDFDNNSVKTNAITSLDYEYIKLKDTFTQKIHTPLCFAIHSFLNCLSGLDKKDVKNSDINTKNPDHEKMVLRFWGGQSFVSFNSIDKEKGSQLINELNKHLYDMRNNFFHYNDEKKVTDTLPSDKIKELHKIEIAKFNEIVFEKYSSNNIFTYYDAEKICKNIINVIYNANETINSYIPSFNKVWSFNTFLKDCNLEEERLAHYFLYKEIYYGMFINKEESLKYITEAFNKNEPHKDEKAFDDFKMHFIKSISLAELCENVLRDFAETNTKKRAKQINEHYKIILNQIIQSAFVAFLKNEIYIDSYIQKEPKNELSIDKTMAYVNIQADENVIENLTEWYVLAKFSSPKQLNIIKGVLLNACQFNKDIKKRERVFGKRSGNKINSKVDFYIENASKIVKIINFAQLFCGRIINNWQDYYTNKDEFAKTMGKFIDFSKNTFDELQQFDANNIYSDKQNPILHSTIEQARLFGSENILSKIFENQKVSQITYDNYSKIKNSSNYSFYSNCIKSDIKDEITAKTYVDFRQIIVKNKNIVTLTDVSKISSLLFDLYAQLISWEYKYERDKIYILMALTYFCDREKLTSAKNITVYGISLGGNNSSISIGDKFDDFEKNYLHSKQQYEQIMCLNGLRGKYRKTRNCIDHFDLFSNKHDLSILDLYNIMLAKFEYDRKTKNDIFAKFKNILISYFIEVNLKFVRFTKDEQGILKQVLISGKEDIKNKNSDEKFEFSANNKGKMVIKKFPHELNSKNFENACYTLLKY